MSKFLAHRLVFSMLLAPLGIANAAALPTALEVRSDLQALADTLKWQGSVYDTYAPVLDKASEAYNTISTFSDNSTLDSQAHFIRQRLERLMVESQYFVTESSDPAYQPDPLETPEYLTANVAEWRYAVTVMSNNLEEPVCDITSNLPEIEAQNISSAAEPGTEFRDSALTPTMVIIPAGSYTAGATPEEHTRWRVELAKQHFELPRRQVTIAKPLAFSRTEVTVAEFDTFIQHTCYQPRGGARWWDPQNPDFFGFNEELSYQNPGFPQTPDHPVVAVTRNDAEAYAHWLSAITGAIYRLPNEDEWEWAARGGTQTPFFWGIDLTEVSQYANTYDNSSAEANHFRWPSNGKMDGFPHTAPVASFKPNGFGLYDVTANAREFMADDWIANLTTASTDGSVHKGPAPFPVVRGGAWNYNPRNLRMNYRSGYLSSEVATNMFGIRLVRDL